MEKQKKLIEKLGECWNDYLEMEERLDFKIEFSQYIHALQNAVAANSYWKMSTKIGKPGTVEPVYRGADEDEKIAFIRGWVEKYGDKEYATKEHLVSYIKGLIE